MSAKQQDAFYRPLPELSPYASGGRYERTKEVHKFYAAQVSNIVDVAAEHEIMDVGCGNGELLYALKPMLPNAKLHGTDLTPEFIQCARDFPGLSDVQFEVCDFFETAGHYDIVFCTGVLQIFSDIEPALQKLLDLTKAGGHIFCDGLFNKWDMEVRIEYCDNSNDISEGKWRSDWTQHSRKRIGKFLDGVCRSYEFVDVEMDLDISPNPDIHTRQHTFRDAAGRNLITNGTNLILNKTMLTMQK